MRITELQKQAIVDAIKNADDGAKAWLFGSRADDSKKGGDIDIGILSDKIGGLNTQRNNCGLFLAHFSLAFAAIQSANVLHIYALYASISSFSMRVLSPSFKFSMISFMHRLYSSLLFLSMTRSQN